MNYNEPRPFTKGTTGTKGTLGTKGATGTKRYSEHLNSAHRRMLLEGSAISGEVLAENDIRTISHGRELPRGFSRRQRRRGPGVLFKVLRPNGEHGYSFRPDAPDPEEPGRKYEQPCKALGGPGNILGVYETAPGLLEDADTPLVFVEGVKKALSLVSAYRAARLGLAVVAISGVWNWLSREAGGPIPDMLGLAVEGRRCEVVFDSDVLTNSQVQDAARRLAEHLVGRGAEVWVAYLRGGPDGSKTGADDFFVGGGTPKELKMLMRPYDPADFAIVRLSRDEKLRALVEDLGRTLWSFEWRGMGGRSARDAFLALALVAAESGRIHPDGVTAPVSWRTLQLRAGIGSSQTLSKVFRRLEEAELGYRDNEGRKGDKPGTFVLRASVKQVGTKAGGEDVNEEEQVTRALQRLTPDASHLRAPRLRWSDPGRKARRGLIKRSTRVRETRVPARPPRKRLGKIRGAVIDALDAAGGELPLRDLYDVLKPAPRAPGKRRPRDLRRRQLPMLEAAGIITVYETDSGLVVSLADNWTEALRIAREIGGEIEAEELAREKFARQRRAYRTRNDVKPDRHWANAGADGYVEDLEGLEGVEGLHRDKELRGAELPPDGVAPGSALGTLAAAVRDYLDRNPQDACQPPGWIGTTLWAYGLFSGKSTPAEVRVALGELGGEAYLRGLLRREGAA